MRSSDNPLVGQAPTEIPLPRAPLVRVIAQVRFPLVAALERRDFVAPIQESIRGEYPVLRADHSKSVVFGDEGAVEARNNTAWRFEDESGDWRVTLAPDFLALQTRRYSSREDFFARFGRILESFSEHVEPAVIDRLGIRYIDRVAGSNLQDLPKLVRPEVSGVSSTPLVAHALQSISQAVFELPEESARLMTRWGLVPSGATVDPGAVDPIHESSWLLDFDAYDASTRKFNMDSILTQANSFSERIYSVFRWVVNDEFLRRYGGRI